MKGDPESFKRFIRGSMWFKYLPDEAIDVLVAQARLRQFESGQYIIAKEEVSGQVYGLMGGMVRASLVTPGGRDVALADLEIGEWMGAYSLAGGDGSASDLIARQSCELLAVPVVTIQQVGERWPQLYRGLFENFVVRSRGMTGLVQLIGAHELPARLAIRLLMFVEQQAKRKPGDLTALHVHINQTELATLCFGARQTVNRVLSNWADEGIVKVQSDGILVTDVGGLMAKAQETGLVPPQGA